MKSLSTACCALDVLPNVSQKPWICLCANVKVITRLPFVALLTLRWKPGRLGEHFRRRLWRHLQWRAQGGKRRVSSQTIWTLFICCHLKWFAYFQPPCRLRRDVLISKIVNPGLKKKMHLVLRTQHTLLLKNTNYCRADCYQLLRHVKTNPHGLCAYMLANQCCLTWDVL